MVKVSNYSLPNVRTGLHTCHYVTAAKFNQAVTAVENSVLVYECRPVIITPIV
jgi:hypothetical protein